LKLKWLWEVGVEGWGWGKGGGTKHRKECIRQAIIGGIKTGKPYTAYPKTQNYYQ
jgi:hypothetical protein